MSGLRHGYTISSGGLISRTNSSRGLHRVKHRLNRKMGITKKLTLAENFTVPRIQTSSNFMERHFRVTENNFGPLRFPYKQVSLYRANFVKYEVCRERTDSLHEIYEMFV